MNIINQLHPYDFCELQSSQEITLEHQKMLQLCYQPIIGVNAVALYLKLWVELSSNHHYFAHHYLLDSLNFSIKQLFQARITLEAIGLMKTYEKKTESGNMFIYKIQAPYAENEFFDDPILSVSLLRAMKERPFKELRDKLVKKPISYDGYTEVSRSFTDVFMSATEPELRKLVELSPDTSVVYEKKSYPFEYDLFDFKLFMQGFNEYVVPKRLFTLDIKIAIAKIAFLYNLSPIDMQKVVLMTLNAEDQLNIPLLTKNAEDYLRLTSTTGDMPKLVKRYDVFEDQVVHQESQATKESKKEEHIKYLDTTSPIKVYQDLNDVLPSESLVFMFNNFIRQGISYGVINTLIEYIAFSKEYTYTKNFMEVVLNEWISKGAKTASDAIELAQEAYDLRKNYKQHKVIPTITKQHLQQKEQHNAVPNELVDFKTATPYQMLKTLNKGREPLNGDIQTAEMIHNVYGFPIDVTNYIIDYVWKKTEGRLPSKFVESVIGELRQQNIETLERAMEYLQQQPRAFRPKITESMMEGANNGSRYDRTPYEFLKSLFDGREPMRYLIEMAENLHLQHSMPVSVVNVLFEYAINESDGKLSKNYIQIIASHWMSKQLSNAEEALAFIEQEKRSKEATSKVTVEIPRDFKRRSKDLSKWIEHYDETVPYEFMKNILEGKEPMPYLVSISDELVLKNEMRVGVVNVIFEYVLKSMKGRVGKNTIQSIAFNMQLENIQFAKDALDFIETRYKNLRINIQIKQSNLASFYPKEYLFTEENEKYEKHTPYEFIRLLNDDNTPFAYTVKTAENLIVQYKMVPGVVNYLLEYVTKNTDGALPEKYILSVADSWRRNKIQTVSQAKAFVKQIETNKQLKRGKKVGVVPDWLLDEPQTNSAPKQPSTEQPIDTEERRRKLRERFSKK